MTRTAVVGAGWAGLAAASTLAAAGHGVTVFEAARTPGGRARRVDAPGWPAPLDNGQHILLGAYTETLGLMRRLGRDPEHMLLRRRLHIERLDGSFRLRAPALPAPFHATWALARARGLTMAERWSAVRMMRALAHAQWQAPSSLSVQSLLHEHRQSGNLTRALWEPLCLAALNTPLEQASAALFVRVLGDSLAGARSHSDLLLPLCDLSSLWPDVAASRCDTRFGVTVRRIEALADGNGAPDHSPKFAVEGENFDNVVLATPPAATSRFLQAISPSGADHALGCLLDGFAYSAIGTLNLRLAGPWRLPQPMMMLTEAPERGHDGQWVFDRAALTGRKHHGELAIVVSAARDLLVRDRADAISALIAQLTEQCSHLPKLPVIEDTALYIDKRATFLALPGLQRPGNATSQAGLVIAGDWTDTGYPGVLEGAVRSGLAAARLLIGTR